jgi:hypothetical protein
MCSGATSRTNGNLTHREIYRQPMAGAHVRLERRLSSGEKASG